MKKKKKKRNGDDDDDDDDVTAEFLLHRQKRTEPGLLVTDVSVLWRLLIRCHQSSDDN